MREGCCRRVGAFPENYELEKITENTYHACGVRVEVPGGYEDECRPVPRPRRWGKEGWARNEKTSPQRTAAASAGAQEQSQWSSALPGRVSVTTISVLESTYRSEPTWRLWSGPSSASFHLHYAMPPTHRLPLHRLLQPRSRMCVV